MSNLAMKNDDVAVMCDAYRNGLVPLKAAALALGVYRRQKTRPTPLTVPDLIDWTGAKRSQAYEAVQMVNLFLSARQDASASPEIPESRNPGFPDDPSGIPGQMPPPPYQPPCIEGLRESYSSPPAREAVEPFAADPEPLRGMPGPPGPSSPQALALRAKFAPCGTAPGKVRDNYGEIAARLCGMYAAEWVDIAMTCQLLLWGNTPGQPNLSQTLRRWEVAGEVESDWLKAFNAPLRAPIPLRATGTAGRPNPVRSLAEDLRDL